MRKIIAIFFLFTFFTASQYLGAIEQAKPEMEFDEGINDYENGDYQNAILKLTKLLDELKLTSIDKIIKAHSILGASYLFTDNEEKSRSHFKAILNFSPDYELSSTYFPPKVVNFYNELKGTRKPEQIQEGLATKTKDSQGEKSVKSQEGASSKTSDITTTQLFPKDSSIKDENYKNSFMNSFIPFGFGQFKNSEPTKGYFFLTSEVITLISTITTLAVFKGIQNDDGTFDNPSVGNGLKSGFYTSLSFLTALTVTGIADAILNHKSFPFAKSKDSPISLSITTGKGINCALLLDFNNL